MPWSSSYTWPVCTCHTVSAMLLLVPQEENLLSGGQGWKQQYFMPTASDRGVSLLRRWIDREGGGGPRYGPHAPPLQV